MNYNGCNYLPILFQTEMVKAILEGRKTQTRRLHKKQRYKLGDRLWVRETWTPVVSDEEMIYIQYSDCSEVWRTLKNINVVEFGKKKPSIHMPFGAHRIELEVIGVKQERLKNISHDDAIAEGVEFFGRWKNYDKDDFEGAAFDYIYASAYDSFASLWRSINGCESWAQNPLVTAYTFKRIVP